MINKFRNQNLISSLQKSLDSSVCNYFAIETARSTLNHHGFTELNYSSDWKLVPGNFFFTRNETSLFAFKYGNLSPSGFKIVGTHSDSPNLRLAPNAHVIKEGYSLLNLQTYGGGKWETFFDRDLSLAGKVVYAAENGSLKKKLVRLDDTTLHIPHLAIHLCKDRGTFTWNNETHLKALLSIANNELPNLIIEKRLGKQLAAVLAKQADIPLEAIIDFDLHLFDKQRSKITGINGEFLSCGQLDNLLSSFVALDGFISSANTSTVNLLAIFDNEEIGSGTNVGAASRFFSDSLARIHDNIYGQNFECYQRFLTNSFASSIDMAHAVHPNYSDKHQNEHKPIINGGIVLKSNCNGRYTTDVESGAVVRRLAQEFDFKVQDFIVRQDGGCGSTIGPIMSANTGIKCVDIGVAQLGMHSIRELAGVDDLEHLRRFVVGFYEKEDLTIIERV